MNSLDNAEFEKRTSENVEYVEKILKDKLPKIDGLQKKLFESMEYSVMAGGKRIRPILMLETYRLVKSSDELAADIKTLEVFMTAMECIHTYSLVHDDLPAMDNDEYRRGRKTTHVVYGPGMATLTGDALLGYAFEMIGHNMQSGAWIDKKARALSILADKAGVNGMVGGQSVDVDASGHRLSSEQIEFIYRLKTCALIEASMMIGAVLAGADDKLVKLIEKIGYCVGMAFQIQDDILDITSTTDEIGKPVHSDEKNEKTTYVTLNGLINSKNDIEHYSEDALRMLDETGMKNEYLKTLIISLMERKK